MIDDPNLTIIDETTRKRLDAKQKNLHLQINHARALLNAKKTSAGIEAFFAIATEMVLIGKITKATAIYKIILREEPNNSLALAFLSGLYQHQGLAAEVQHLNSLKVATSPNLENSHNETFSDTTIKPSDIKELEKICPVRRVVKNEVIITQNQENHKLYLIVEGRIQIQYQGSDSKAKKIATLSAGNFFGEITMLLPHRQATATIVALETGKLLTVGREEFKAFLNNHPDFLKSLIKAAHKHLLEYTLRPLFCLGNNRDQLWLSRIAESFKIKAFSARELILKEGERNQSLHVILDGKLEVSCQGKGKNHTIPITTLSAGDFFGEFSLLTGEAASATVKALSDGWIACLKRRDVDRLTAHFPDFLPRILNSFRERKQNLIQKKISSLSPPPGP